jgi:hypothetical protein
MSADRPLIEGKFKSAHNSSERVAQLMASTFYSLLALADTSLPTTTTTVPVAPAPEPKTEVNPTQPPLPRIPTNDTHTTQRPTLHYNIQIHLPATKDVEVFNAIFKALREHLLD